MTARTERQPRTQDVEALIGVLAVLEAEIRGEQSATIGLDVERLRDRLVRVGLLGPDADVLETALALGNINQRLRYVLGEYETEDEGTS
jgi:hypothetical protein